MGEVKKYVLTGVSGCGKSSLIDEFENRGYCVLKEVAEPYILEQQSKGIEKPWLSKDFQPVLLELQYRNEDSIHYRMESVFMDRALPDVLAFFEHRKENVPAGLKARIGDYVQSYTKIFFLESIDIFNKSDFRVESGFGEAAKIGNIIRRIYSELGYEIIDIPFFPGDEKTAVGKRADYILEHVDSW